MRKVKTQRKLFALVLLFLIVQSTSVFSQSRLSDTESRFYSNVIPNTTTNVTLTGANSTADSNTLQAQIDATSNAGGGIITITNTSGNAVGQYYLLDVELKSNVHLKIAADVELIARSFGKIFYIGENTYAENVAITNLETDNTDPATWTKINLAQGLDYTKNWSFLKIANANNFKVSGFRIEDNHSRISGITMGADVSESKSNIPNNGIVKDIVMSISHVGFGVAQVQASKTVLFKNLDGTGGTTLRLESGLGILNNDTLLTLDDVVGRDIISRNGDGAVVLSPHRLNQGVVDLDRLYSYSSTFAVSIASGFLDNTGSGSNLGVFDAASYIGDIYAVGGNFSQVKSKNFKYYDCTTRQALVDRCGKSLQKPALDIEAYPAQSISVIKDIANSSNGCTGGSANGCYDVNFGGTITKGNADFVFPTQNTVDNSDKITGSCSLTIRANCAQPYPLASYTTSASGNSVTFDASSSSDDGSIVEYQWIFGDGTFGDGQNITHTFSQSGSYAVTLAVRDNNDAVTTTLEIITISGVSNIAVTGISVSPIDLILDVNQTSNLTATVSPANATDASVTWSSNNTAVATVDVNGVVTAVSAGAATITATTTDGGFTDTTSITVNEQIISVTGISVSPIDLVLDVNQTSSLTATVSPANATDASVTWSSNNTAVATVDVNGVVTAVSAGAATITATTTDGGFTDTTSITVNEQIITVTGINVSPIDLILDVNQTSSLTATVSPANATDASVLWTSNNTAVATVDVNGVVTAVSAGAATITSTTNDGGFTDTTSVTVNQPQAGGFTTFIYDDFEGGLGNWIDGGKDASLYTGGTFAHQGANAIDLQDNTKTSVISTNNLALSGVNEVKVEFWYKAKNFGNSNEDFWLQISTNGGSSYTTVKAWAEGIDFQNNHFNSASFTISGITLNNQTRLRFRCDASSNSDDVYLDEIKVSVSGAAARESLASTVVKTKVQEFSPNKILVYPNPLSNQLNINFDASNKYKFIKLFDLTGKVILERNVTSNKMQLDLSSYRLSKGIYLLKLIAIESTKTLKLIKQ